MLKQQISVFSFNNYYINVSRQLKKFNVNIRVTSSFKSDEGDLYWYPFSTPPLSLLHIQKPLVVTLLGDYAFGIPIKELYEKISIKNIMKRYTYIAKIKFIWNIFKYKVNRIITVSQYSKSTLSKYLGIDSKSIEVIYHGVDHDIFNPRGPAIRLKRPYLIHVSQYVPGFHGMKNLRRVLKAYRDLRVDPKPYLLLIVPGYPYEVNVDGVILIRNRLPPDELVKFYRGALALVFPSIHETFGMPVLEAMASGCPVITSNVTALPEVAGDAALLVDPYSVEEIRDAMEAIIVDEDLRNKLRMKGIKRAKLFTWESSARKHYEVFIKVYNNAYT